jgi:histidinol-phosphatase (PHP family)
MSRLVYETHSHTPLCKHAVGTPEDYAQRAWDRGLKGLTITCHGPLPDGLSADIRMSDKELETYLELVARARETWEGRIDVRLGLESDYLPGLEPWIERLHQRADFHYILGSVHPQLGEYRERYYHGDWTEFHRLYFQHLGEAAETGFYDCLAHPDIVKNLGSDHWNLQTLMPDILRALDRVAATGMAMELNTSGLNKKIQEMNPSPTMLREMRARNIPVVVGADAHEPGRAGDRFEDAYTLLEQAGYTDVSYFLERKRHSLPIAAARTSLKGVPS